MKPYKRKVLLINRQFQLSILSWFILLSFFVLGIIYSANYYFFHLFIQDAMSAGIPADHMFFKFINEQKMTMNRLFLGISVFIFIVLSVGGLILSHKVAGPLYRLTQYLKQNSPKSAIPLKFRKGDYFPEIEEAFNEFIKKD